MKLSPLGAETSPYPTTTILSEGTLIPSVNDVDVVYSTITSPYEPRAGLSGADLGGINQPFQPFRRDLGEFLCGIGNQKPCAGTCIDNTDVCCGNFACKKGYSCNNGCCNTGQFLCGAGCCPNGQRCDGKGNCVQTIIITPTVTTQTIRPDPTSKQPPPPTTQIPQSTRIPPPTTQAPATSIPPPTSQAPPPTTRAPPPTTQAPPPTTQSPSTTSTSSPSQPTSLAAQQTTSTTTPVSSTLSQSTTSNSPTVTDSSASADDPTIPGAVTADATNNPTADQNPLNVLQSAVPKAAQSDPESACFLSAQYTSYYTTPSWYKDLPTDAQNFYSSANVATSHSGLCTATALPDSSAKGHKLSPGGTAGAVVGSVAGAAVLGSLLLWAVKAGLFSGAAAGKLGGDAGAAASSAMGPTGAEHAGWSGVSGQGAPPPAPPANPPMHQVVIPPVVAGGYRRSNDEENQRQYRPWPGNAEANQRQYMPWPGNAAVAPAAGVAHYHVPRQAGASPSVSDDSGNGYHNPPQTMHEAGSNQIWEASATPAPGQLDGNQVYEAPPDHHNQWYGHAH